MLSNSVATAASFRSSDAGSLLPLTGICRILVCRPTHSLGNTLLLTPLLRELQHVYPGAEIDIVTRTPVGVELFGRFSNVKNVYCLPAHGVWRPDLVFGVVSRMRRTNYDLVIDPHPRSRTGRTLLAMSRGRFKLGFAGYRSASLTHAVDVAATPAHVGQRPVSLLQSALGRSSVTAPTLDIALSESERRDGLTTLQRMLDVSGKTAERGVIGVFANATGPKLQSEAWWTSLLEVMETRYPQTAFVEIVPAFGRSMLSQRYPMFYCSNLRRLAGLLSQLSLFVSSDCGVMHLACASGVPVTGIFTATDSAEWGPYGPHDRVIDARGLPPEHVADRITVPFHD